MNTNWKSIEHRIYTMCMIQHNNEVLLMHKKLGISPSFSYCFTIFLIS